MFNCETDIINYLKEQKNWKKHFPKYKIIGFEQYILGFLSRKIIGKVDIVFRARNKKYFAEVKYDKKQNISDFWTALKVIGYVEAYKLFSFNRDVEPLIIVNKEVLTQECKTILYSLRISWIVFEISENKIKFDIQLNS